MFISYLIQVFKDLLFFQPKAGLQIADPSAIGVNKIANLVELSKLALRQPALPRSA